MEGRTGVFHRPHFTPKEYTAAPHLNTGRTSTGNNRNIHAVSRPSLPPSNGVSSQALPSHQHTSFASKGQQACLSRHSTPADLPDRHTALESLSLVNGLGLDFGLLGATEDINDTTGFAMGPCESFVTGKYTSVALDDTAVTAHANAEMSPNDDQMVTVVPPHSYKNAEDIERTSSAQDHLLGAMLEGVHIEGDPKTPSPLALHCTSDDRVRPDLACRTLPLPHPEMLAHTSDKFVSSSTTGGWNSEATSFSPHRSWPHKGPAGVPSESLTNTSSEVPLASKNVSGPHVHTQTDFAEPGHFGFVSSTPRRHHYQHVSMK